MISFLARSSSIAPSFSATCQTVPSIVRPIIPAFLDKAEKVFVEPPPRAENAHSLAKYISQGVRLNPSVTASLGGTTQVRLAHTDVQFPDYTEYRRDSVKSPNRSSDQSSQSRKAFNYMIVAAASVPATYMTKTFVTQLVSSMAMSADVLALAKVEVKLADIPEGKNVTIKWRGKPLFVRHRTVDEIEKEQDVPLTELKHPETDTDRTKKPDWLVVIGVCTHLGCVPVANVGDYGGYYCPCHGSHYDASGRIRKGPAPLNLEVPEYTFPDEETLIVG